MIDNFSPTVIINEAPSTYNDNIRYSDSGYFLCVIDSRKVNSGSPVEVKRSDTKRGYRMPESSEGEDIYIEVIPTADGSKEIAWYYLDEAPCVIEDPYTFFTPCNINTMELNGFQISGIDEYPLSHVVASFDNTVSGNVLDMRGMTFGNNHTYKLDFSDFNGTLRMPNTTAKISELNFENVGGNVIGLANLHTTVSCECSFLNAQITSLNISGIDLTNFSEFNIDSMDNVNMSNATFGTSVPLNCKLLNSYNITGLDFSSLTGDKLSGILKNESREESSFDLTGWKIPNAPIKETYGDYDSLIYSGGYYPSLDVTDWDLQGVTNIDGLFCAENHDMGYHTRRIAGLDTWDVSDITSMKYLFYQNQLPDLSQINDWDVSNVTDFTRMFNTLQAYYDEEQEESVSVWDYSGLDDWRDKLSPTATYTAMFLTGYYYGYEARFPEWNGWIDYNGTFIPYIGSNPSEVTFKGLKENLPDAPTFGDAYTISGGYDDNTFYYWGANNEWVEYQPT